MLSERDVMRCIGAAGCYGNVKMTFESGLYSIDRPTINATRFAEQIESAACEERDARIAELEAELRAEADRRRAEIQERERLEQQLAEARRKATEDAYEFNRAINFAIDQGLEACHFLAAWREGDPSGWPEFDAAIKEQT